MRTSINAQLREESDRYQFKFGCPNCVYFVEDRRECSEGFPNGEHLSPLLGEAEVVFCKRFELL